jgi:hypothetical protein
MIGGMTILNKENGHKQDGALNNKYDILIDEMRDVK